MARKLQGNKWEHDDVTDVEDNYNQSSSFIDIVNGNVRHK